MAKVAARTSLRSSEQAGTSLHELDEHAWIGKQVEALRSGDYGSLDRDNLAEFLTSVALRDERELESRLAAVLLHLAVKVYAQPTQITRSWRLTIVEQQLAIDRLLKKLPSLRARAGTVLEEARPAALRLARAETGLPLLESTPMG